MRVTHTPGIVIFADANTTIAYCRYNEAGEIEYIFVNSAFRRKGYARQLLALVEERVQSRLRFHTPISPLGCALIAFYHRHKRL
jgi:GNAT superfamily N-acetyltransferase